MVVSEVGSRARTLFWTDRWLNGQSIADLAPHLLAVIPKRTANRHTVEQALTNRSWDMDIRGDTSVEVIVEFLNLWDLLYDFQLRPEVEDSHLAFFL